MRIIEQENYFDTTERGEYSTDPRDLVPEVVIDSSNRIIYDIEAFRQLMGDDADRMIVNSRVMSREEILIAA